MKVVIVSDIHFNAWSLFSGVTQSGVNTRLQIVIDELKRAAKHIIGVGGKTMIVAGDIFHKRGVMDPEVLNPVRDAFEEILSSGVDIHMIPGNHDLKSEDTNRLSSSIQNLAQISILGNEVVVHNKATILELDRGSFFGFVPWRKNTETLLKDLKTISKSTMAPNAHVIVHAGIDGVLSGMPGHGLTSRVLSKFGFKGVYAGHYHNHADMSVGLPNRVMSIGASTHQNWGDVGTRAGFLVLDTDENTVEFIDTQAPKFIDISGLSELDIELSCPGNYVRFRGPEMTQEETNELRKQLVTWGALGVSIEVPRKVINGRSTAPNTGLSLEQSVVGFVKEIRDLPPGVEPADVSRRATEVLSEVRLVE